MFNYWSELIILLSVKEPLEIRLKHIRVLFNPASTTLEKELELSVNIIKSYIEDTKKIYAEE